MAVFTVKGREVIAALLKEATFFLAVGTGDEAWDSAIVPPSPTDTDLVAKVGVTRLRQIDFAVPDDNGTIVFADGSKFSVSETPTRYLYMSFKLDLNDAVPNSLREYGLVYGTEIAGSVPGGQMYIEDEDVVEYGTLIQIERFNSIVRDGTIEQTFSLVVTL